METWRQWRHWDIDMETWKHEGVETLNVKRKIFLKPLTFCSLCKRKFVACPFVDEKTNGINLFANGVNGLNGPSPHIYANRTAVLERMGQCLTSYEGWVKWQCRINKSDHTAKKGDDQKDSLRFCFVALHVGIKYATVCQEGPSAKNKWFHVHDDGTIQEGTTNYVLSSQKVTIFA